MKLQIVMEPLEYLEENGANEVRLSADDLNRLDAIAPRGITAGLRYPEQHMQAVGILVQVQRRL